jgi:DNA polymerase III subunit alpha
MTAAGFVHLHVHTHYSLLDGACRVDDLVAKAKAMGMTSLAITDHGCLFGVIDFYNECKKAGIKPIIGMEAYMAPGDRRLRQTVNGEASYHLLLLAQNLTGYKNLVKLASTAYRDGFYYKPRIDKEILSELREGLICTSACLGGELPSALLKRDAKTAKKIAETYLEIFGPDRFFIEVQKQGLKEQDQVNPELAELAKKLGVGLVATNDVHFLEKDDHHAHDVLCCISMGKLITDETRLKYPKELYLKSPDEMSAALGHFDQAIENTQRVAAMCDLTLDFSKRFAPVYKVPKESLNGHGDKTQPDDQRYLRQLCEEGLEWRYGTKKVSPEIRQRLDYELRIIGIKNFCSYFLIVWDFCNYARGQGIPVGARGSGVGTMVGYLLGLCNVDPVKYGLLFERFMDPSRDEMPDIDIDMCQEGRQKVIEYVRAKYGQVAQIITFGHLAAKAVCKDVGRVLGVPLSLTDKLTKLIPGSVGMTLDKALKQVPDLSALYNNDAQVSRIIDIGKRLEGLCRNAGTHAAGVVIADQPLENFVPLYKAGDDLLTQFEGPIVEKVGLLKMDFLGLRTLTVLQRSIDLVKQTKGIEIDIEKVDFADRKVLDLFCRGQTKGVFQFESPGMQDLLMKMRPDRLDDLIAANALYRPGPMELIPLYCNRKHGKEAVPSVHPIMDKILADTYGIMVYQEQVMQIFNQLGGIELSAAYKLVKAISKKQTEVIAKYKPNFIDGAVAKGIARDKAVELFELILKFGGYGFNKSHSTRYAIVAFQTAYMKTYYPVEYMAALLTFEMGDTKKIEDYLDECRQLSIQVQPPDVNASDKDFTPVHTAQGKRKAQASVIRFGMMAVKGVGQKAVEAVIAERQAHGPFTGLYDFCDRVNLQQVPRSTIEALVKCGAFASMNGNRAQFIAVLEKAVETGAQAQQDRRLGQMSMFGQSTDAASPRLHGSLPDLPEMANAELLKFEKELLGFYITSHPLTERQSEIERYSSASSRDVARLSEGTEVTIGAMISEARKRVTKNGRSAGQQMAILTLEDLDGQIEVTIFAESLAEIMKRRPDALAKESIVFVRGKVDKRREKPGLVAADVIPLADASGRLTTAVRLDLSQCADVEVIKKIKPLLARHKGGIQVYVQAGTLDGKSVMMLLERECSVRPSAELVKELESLLGEGRVQLAGVKRRPRVQEQPLFTDAEAMPSAEAADVLVPAGEMEE